MGFLSTLFGREKKRRLRIRRSSVAVRRLARSRGVSPWDLDLQDDSVMEELLILGLILMDGEYVDDVNYVEEEIITPETPVIGATEPTAELTPSIVEEPVLVEPEPVVQTIEAPTEVPSVSAPEAPSTPSWTSETPSWGGSSFDSGDSGGGFDSGGGDFGD